MPAIDWERLPDADTGATVEQRRAGHTTTLVGSKVFVFGGRCGGHQVMNDLWQYDLELGKWKRLQEHAPFAGRAYHSATLVGTNKLWIIGGIHGTNVQSDVHVLNTDTLEWSSPALRSKSKPRAHHAAVVLSPKCILLYGGCDSLATRSWCSDLVALNTDTLQWKTLQPGGPRPSPRGYHSFTKYGNKVLLFGGMDNNGNEEKNLLSVFDAFANAWSEIKTFGEAPCSRANHAAVLVRETSIIIDGGSTAGGTQFSDMYSLEISGYKWRKLAESRPARSLHTLVFYNDSLYMFGLDWKGAKLSDVYLGRGLDFFHESEDQSYPVSGRPVSATAEGDDRESSSKRKLSGIQLITGKSRLVEEHAGSLPAGAAASSRRVVLSALLNEEMKASAILEKELLDQLRTAENKLQEQESSLERARKSHEDAMRALGENYQKQIDKLRKKSDQSDAERQRLLQELTGAAAQKLEVSQEACRAMEEKNISLKEQINQKDEKLSDLSAELKQVKALRNADTLYIELLKTELEAARNFIPTCKDMLINFK